jgi:hypothetical protein
MFNAVVGQKQQLVTNGLVSYWDAQIDATTGSLFEQSGRPPLVRNGIGGEFNTAAASTPAYYKFYGNTSGRLLASASADYDWTNGNVTVGLMVDGSANTNYVYVNQRRGLGASTRYSLHINPGGNTLGIYNGTAFNTISATIDPNIWYVVSFNLSTTSNAVAFLDGRRLGNPAGTTNILSSATLRNFELANTTSDFQNESFDGKIAFCLSYSRPLLDGEVTQNWQYFRDRLQKFI